MAITCASFSRFQFSNSVYSPLCICPLYIPSLHTWAVFVRDGDITSADAEDDDAMPLADELTYTYITGGRKTYEEVGRGWWVSHNPVQDEDTPETAFTNRRLTHQLPPSPPEVVAASVDKEEHADEDDATDND